MPIHRSHLRGFLVAVPVFLTFGVATQTARAQLMLRAGLADDVDSGTTYIIPHKQAIAGLRQVLFPKNKRL